MQPQTCPCTSGKAYDKCCGPFLDGRSAAKTVKQLMRSRFSAFSLGGFGDYLLETWHPDSAAGHSVESLSVRTLNWQGLNILDFSQKGDEGMVEFKAEYVDADGNAGQHHEVSRFVRAQGKWLYQDGELIS